jgi:hypothetical protein
MNKTAFEESIDRAERNYVLNFKNTRMSWKWKPWRVGDLVSNGDGGSCNLALLFSRALHAPSGELLPNTYIDVLAAISLDEKGINRITRTTH